MIRIRLMPNWREKADEKVYAYGLVKPVRRMTQREINNLIALCSKAEKSTALDDGSIEYEVKSP